MIPAGLLGTGSILPGRTVTTSQLVAEAGLPVSPDDMERRTGIRTRHWVDGDERAAQIAARTVGQALDAAGLQPSDLRRLIFVSSTGGDFLIPATANAVLDELGVAHSCDGFDVNNACMGFLTSFDLAARTVATGLAPVAVVTVETLSRFLTPKDPRPVLVLADAAAAAVLGEATGGGGVLASTFGNDGAHRGSVALAHPGLTGQAEHIVFAASNREITEGALDAVQQCARRVLADCGLTMEEMDWVVPHQPNGSMLQQIVTRLGVAPERCVPVVDEIGSVGAASMGVGLDALMRRRSPKPGQRVLMVGVGAGLAYGALVFELGAQGLGAP